ncbi:hypothetical protein AB0J80_37615 [Actinoplanes sp. NPDC049548]|uniref:hypothetical protein n=1 Tax=Actinoplanes sp. NPDC049548 TaxID=3155152 RepID=UPI0034463C07
MTIVLASGCGNSDEPQKSVATIGPTGGASAPAEDSAPGNRGGNPVAYAKCMRENGVANFPDPDKNGQVRLDPNSGVDQDSPEFRQAQDACKQYIGSAAKVKDDPASAWSTADKLKYTACMREHGLPSFPDPDKNGQVMLPRNVDPQSEQFKSADAACAQYKPQNAPRGGGAGPAGGGS